MSAYHKKAKPSNEKHEQPLSAEHLILSDLQEAVKGRFASFCTAVGIQALMTMMNQDVEAAAGPKGRHELNRTAYRHGSQPTTIAIGNQRLAIERPRVRSIDKNQELPIPSYEAFANDDQLIEAALKPYVVWPLHQRLRLWDRRLQQCGGSLRHIQEFDQPAVYQSQRGGSPESAQPPV